MKGLEIYTNRILHVKRDFSFSKEGALQKPILLLALIDLIDELNITENQFPIDNRLYDLFIHHWNLLHPQPGIAGKSVIKKKIWNPLFHLQTDGFWFLIGDQDEVIKEKITSEKKTKEKIRYGCFEQELFDLLEEPEVRNYFRMILLDSFLPDTKYAYQEYYTLPEYMRGMEGNVAHDFQADYKVITRIIKGYVRSWKFREDIMANYQNTCSISGYHVNPSYSIIDACHIQPHSLKGNQSLTNGIALCVNLHRAFDRGLISIDDKYKVIVKGEDVFKESDSPYNIRQFTRKQILLPKKELYYPSQEYFAAHRQKFNF